MKTYLGPLFLCITLPALALDVELKTGTGTLKGSLEEAGDSRSKIILIHPGSGPTDRDGNSAGLPGKNNSLKYLAETLQQQGVPSLRIDKRGVAASLSAANQEEDIRFQTYVDDTSRWIDFLKKRGYQKIILLGHSEGALVTMLASSHADVSAYISIAGPARSADEVLLEQLTQQLSPYPQLLVQTTTIITDLKAGKTTAQLPPNFPAPLATLFRPSVQPYLISWFKHSPSKEIAKLKKPVLIVHGSTDLQVPVEAAKQLHTQAANSQLAVIKGMNHVLKDTSGTMAQQLPSYSDPKLPLNRQLGSTISEFIKSLP